MRQGVAGIPVQTAAGCPCLAAVLAAVLACDAHWILSTGRLPLEPAPDSAAVPCTMSSHTCAGSKHATFGRHTTCAQLFLVAHPHDEQVGSLCHRPRQCPSSLLTLSMRLNLLLTRKIKGYTAQLLHFTSHAGRVSTT